MNNHICDVQNRPMKPAKTKQPAKFQQGEATVYETYYNCPKCRRGWTKIEVVAKGVLQSITWRFDHYRHR